MKIVMVDTVVKTDAPGMKERRFESVRSALDWVERTVQTKPVERYQVTVTDIYQLFDGEQRKVFEFVYDVPAKLRRSYFSLSGNQGPLLRAAIHFWWLTLDPDWQTRLENRPGEILAQLEELKKEITRWI
jgi:hypothetical protein